MFSCNKIRTKSHGFKVVALCVWPEEAIMQNLGDKDRRIFERFPVSLSLTYFSFDSNKESQAQVTDCSANGMGLKTDENLPPGTPLEMWLSIPDTDQTLYKHGEVVWSNMFEANKYKMGVKLEKTDLMAFSCILRANAGKLANSRNARRHSSSQKIPY